MASLRDCIAAIKPAKARISSRRLVIDEFGEIHLPVRRKRKLKKQSYLMGVKVAWKPKKVARKPKSFRQRMQEQIGVLHVAEDQIRTRFLTLANRWKNETAHLSVMSQKGMHDAYQQIIGMGEAAVPLLLEELKREPGRWFWALKAITQEDPVPPEDRGDLHKMTRAWLGWGNRRGYSV